VCPFLCPTPIEVDITQYQMDVRAKSEKSSAAKVLRYTESY